MLHQIFKKYFRFPEDSQGEMLYYGVTRFPVIGNRQSFLQC